MKLLPALLLALALAAPTSSQRITTIQLDGVQYFISRMNPYSPELNYFLAYQYCRSIGLQLASFETKEKSDSIMQYLTNAGYHKYDFWTSGNRLGTDMLIWMSTGLPFNATFDYMKKAPGEESLPVARQLGAVEQRKDSGAANGCVALKAPDLTWDTDDCTAIKDFICEQTRCYYYNYGSIPVSSAQGAKRVRVSSFLTTATSFTPMSSTPAGVPVSNEEYVSSSTPNPAETTAETVEAVEEGGAEAEGDGAAEGTQATELPSSTTLQPQDGDSTTPPEPPLAQYKARSAPRSSSPSASLQDPQNVPWSWARNIMLEKPVLKKSVSL